MTQYDVLTVSNAVADLIAPVKDIELAKHSLEPGSSLICTQEEQDALYQNLHFDEVVFQGGGSVINSAKVLAELGGGKACLTGIVGNDKEGHKFIQHVNDIGLVTANDFLRHTGLPTGKALIFITQDGERTIRTYLGASQKIEPGDVQNDAVKDSDWVFIEGYLLGNQERGIETVYRAIELAKKAGKKIAFTLSAEFIPEYYPKETEYVVSNTDLLFANSKEGMAFTGKQTWDETFEELKSRGLDVVLSNGADGVLIAYGGERNIYVPAEKDVKVVDTTGAGDALAGGFFAAILKGLSAEEAGKLGVKSAARVISHVGAELHPALEL